MLNVGVHVHLLLAIHASALSLDISGLRSLVAAFGMLSVTVAVFTS
jgi:hypothetical protein